MNRYKVIAVKPVRHQYNISNIEFTSLDNDFSHALYAYVQENQEKLQDTFFVCPNTLSPIIFEFSVISDREGDRVIRSDIYRCTFSTHIEYLAHCIENADITEPFCRIIKSKSGKAGEFFLAHCKDFKISTEQHIKPFTTGTLLDNPKFYFK